MIPSRLKSIHGLRLGSHNRVESGCTACHSEKGLDPDTHLGECDLHTSVSVAVDCLQECIIAHAWRSHEAEETFFAALGRCLVVDRVDGQRNIQGRCSQSLSRSIADSTRDIREATEEVSTLPNPKP